VTDEFRREFQGYQQRTWAGPVEQLDLTTSLLEMGKWLDSLEDLPCEGVRHPSGTLGHTPAAPAEYRVVAPCCGAAVNQCAGRVHALRLTDDLTRCAREQGGCGVVLRTRDLMVVPI